MKFIFKSRVRLFLIYDLKSCCWNLGNDLSFCHDDYPFSEFIGNNELCYKQSYLFS